MAQCFKLRFYNMLRPNSINKSFHLILNINPKQKTKQKKKANKKDRAKPFRDDNMVETKQNNLESTIWWKQGCTVPAAESTAKKKKSNQINKKKRHKREPKTILKYERKKITHISLYFLLFSL